MKLHIETGHPVDKDVQRIDTDRVRVCNEEGRCLFEIRVDADLMAIQVRGINALFSKGTWFGCAISVEPEASNTVLVKLRRETKP